MDERGSRPVANSPDEFHLIQPGKWYGWPDYTGGYPLTLPHFQSDSKPKPGLLLAEHPMRPPHPVATFPPHSAIMGFDFNVHPSFGSIGDVFIAEFGSEAPITTGGKPAPLVGHRVSRIDLTTGRVHPFAYNKSLKAASVTDGGGFERPIDVVFSASNEMYIADFGVHDSRSSERFFTQTGVIWRITPR